MPASIERLKNSYLPVIYKKDVPIVRLVEEGAGEQQQGEPQNEVIISKRKRILESISSLVLTESQKEKAENVIPIIFPLLSIFCTLNYMNHASLSFDSFARIALVFVSTLLIGTPLEVAHGKFKIFCLLLVTIVHSHLSNYYDSGHYYFFDRYIFSYDERPVNIALASLHLTNVVMNWKEMNYKTHRFIIMLILLGPNALLLWAYHLVNFRFLHIINILYTISSIDGVIFGYYWFYGEKKSYLKYALVIQTLAVIILTYVRLLY